MPLIVLYWLDLSCATSCVSSLPIFSIWIIVFWNIFIISSIPPHFGNVFFVSPSKISLINLKIEHSAFVKPLNIAFVLLRPAIQVTIIIKLRIEDIMKKGNLYLGCLTQQQQ